MPETIIALDLGRYNSVACVYDRRTRAHTFRTLDTTPDALTRLFARHPAARPRISLYPGRRGGRGGGRTRPRTTPNPPSTMPTPASRRAGPDPRSAAPRLR